MRMNAPTHLDTGSTSRRAPSAQEQPRAVAARRPALRNMDRSEAGRGVWAEEAPYLIPGPASSETGAGSQLRGQRVWLRKEGMRIWVPAGGEGWGRPRWKVPGVTGAFRGARPRAAHGDAGGKRRAAEARAARSHPEDEDRSLARKPGGKEAGATGWRRVPGHPQGRPAGS